MPPPGDGSGGRREGVRMRFKRAGLLTKVVVMVLLIYMATALLDLHGQIQTIQVEREELNQQVAAQQPPPQQEQRDVEEDNQHTDGREPNHPVDNLGDPGDTAVGNVVGDIKPVEKQGV